MKEETNLLTGHINKTKLIQFWAIVLITLIIWNLPSYVFGIDGLTVIQQRVIAIFAFATLMWLTEAIPSWATSVAIIAVLILTSSDNGLTFLRGDSVTFGNLLDAKTLMATFADPIIILYLGGFILAIAATKSGLDVELAKILIKPFGKRSEMVLLGFILITGVFSMFVSNAATAAMMLTFLAPVFRSLPSSGKGKTELSMSIPLAANLGGMATPVGTPPQCHSPEVPQRPQGTRPGYRIRTVDRRDVAAGHHSSVTRLDRTQNLIPLQAKDHRHSVYDGT